MKLQIVAQTDVGKVRDHNEDNYNVVYDLESDISYDSSTVFELHDLGIVLIVADGMGGEAAGEIASEIVTLSISEYLKSNFTKKDLSYIKILEILKDSIVFAHEQIIEYLKEHPESYGMGTTVAVALIYDNNLFTVWVGDSRIYRFSNSGRVSSHNYFTGNLEILSNDHSLVWKEVLEGKLTPEQARISSKSNIITQSVGDIYKKPVPDSNIFPLYRDDIILLCSDGLNGMLSDEQLNSIIKSNYDDLTRLAKVLIDTANKNGGTDNITLILAKIFEGEIYSAETGNITKEIATKPPVKNKPVSIIEKDISEPPNYFLIVFSVLIVIAIATGIWINANKKEQNEQSITLPTKETTNDTIDSINVSNIHEANSNDSLSNQKDSLLQNTEIPEKSNNINKNIKRAKPKNKSKKTETKKHTEEKAKIDNSDTINQPIRKIDPVIKIEKQNNDSLINIKNKLSISPLYKSLIKEFNKLPKTYENNRLKSKYNKIQKDIRKVNKYENDSLKINKIKNEINELFKKI